MNEKEKQFLKELAELSKKHELYIDGCCGSFIVYSPDDGQVVDRLYWNGEEYSDDL